MEYIANDILKNVRFDMFMIENYLIVCLVLLDGIHLEI